MGINSNNEYYYTYHPLVLKKDIPRLDSGTLDRIRYSIENKLIINPTIYGSPLHGVLRGYWKLRVGDYRVIYSIIKSEIRVFIIGHRKDVYDFVLIVPPELPAFSDAGMNGGGREW